MAEWEKRRNGAMAADWGQNLQLARFAPPQAEQQVLMRALVGEEEDTRRFFLAREGMIPPETFFNPANIRRIVAGSLATES
jgi:hypothetical protein